jgi:hypothetical protein
MRPSVKPVSQALEAYARAIKPTPELVHALTQALALELSATMGGQVTITLPGNVRITRGT